jgi:hypothetical protein
VLGDLFMPGLAGRAEVGGRSVIATRFSAGVPHRWLVSLVVDLAKITACAHFGHCLNIFWMAFCTIC